MLVGTVRKDFRNLMGNATYDLGKRVSDALPFMTFVRSLRDYIEKARLNGAAAYDLTRSMLTGGALDFCNSQENSGVSYPFFFDVLQTMGTKHFSPDSVLAEIGKLRSQPPRNMNKYLMELWNLNTLLHSRVPEHLKFGKISDSYRADVHSMLAQHYPHLLTTIRDKDEALYIAYATELQHYKDHKLDLKDMQNSYHTFSNLTKIVLTHTCAEEVADVPKHPAGRRTGQTSAVWGSTDQKSRGVKSKDNRRSRDDGASMAVQTGGRRRDNQDGRQRENKQQSGQKRTNNQGNRPERRFGEPKGQFQNKNEHSVFPRRGDNNAVNTGTGRTSENISCTNCARMGHRWRVCKKYEGATPGTRKCGQCGGSHAASCVDKDRRPAGGAARPKRA
jgi:hypothetical protein